MTDRDEGGTKGRAGPADGTFHAATPESEQCALCRLGRASGDAGCPFRERVLPAGSCLALPQSSPDSVWYLHRGEVVVSSSDETGKELSCCVRGAGSLVGLESLGERPFAFEAWCLNEVVLCRMTVNSFKAWVSSGGPPATTALSFAADEIARRAAEREVLTGSTEERIARLLLRAAPDDAAHSWQLPIPASVLARVLAVRAETISRALTKLREAGVLSPGRAIVVCDRAQLGLIAGD